LFSIHNINSGLSNIRVLFSPSKKYSSVSKKWLVKKTKFIFCIESVPPYFNFLKHVKWWTCYVGTFWRIQYSTKSENPEKKYIDIQFRFIWGKKVGTSFKCMVNFQQEKRTSKFICFRDFLLPKSSLCIGAPWVRVSQYSTYHTIIKYENRTLLCGLVIG